MYHNIAHTICGGTAFLYDHHPVAGEKIMAKHTLLVTGEQPVEGQKIFCGTCGEPVAARHLAPGLNTYDMTSTEDMEKLYGVAKS